MARAAGSTLERPAWIRRWVRDHVRTLLATLGQLAREPLSTLLTAAVIGITLALPAALHVVVSNFTAISYSWEGTVQASLFIRDDVSTEQGRTLAADLRGRADVARATYISREQSLVEFRELSGFGEALDLLADNPLPAVIVVTPRRELPQAEVGRLVDELGRLPEVELAKLDQKWLERLYAILAIIQRGVLIVAALLALAVVVTVGNTIRLDIENRREEIMVMKLIGAPDAFIRRPFLYTGLWYGVFGGLIAWGLVNAALAALAGPAHTLAGLYESSFELQGLPLESGLIVVAAGVVLGGLGSALTVGRHLNRYEPT